MTDKEILDLWHEGYTRLNLAKIYMQRYNQQVKIIRLDMKNRHVRFITYKEALNRVERILIEDIKERR